MDSMPSLAILKINFHFKKWGYITQHLSTRFVHVGRKTAQPKLRNQQRLGISVFPPALPLTRLYSAVQTPHIPQLFPLTCHSTQCMYTVHPRNLHSIILYLSTDSYIKNNTILRHFKYGQCFASLCSQQITKIASLFQQLCFGVKTLSSKPAPTRLDPGFPCGAQWYSRHLLAFLSTYLKSKHECTPSISSWNPDLTGLTPMLSRGQTNNLTEPTIQSFS